MMHSVSDASEGRARLARPSLCVAFLSLLVFLTTAAPASALMAPILEETDPASPGSSLTPSVIGDISTVDTAAIGFGLRGLGPVTRAESPDNTVKLYTAAGCTGAVVGEGTVAELKDEGVQVSTLLPIDQVTTFYANQTDSLMITSDCSAKGLAYRQVTTAPDAPSFDSVNPASPANDNFPQLIGTVDPEAIVTIYAGASCSGSVVASGGGTEFGDAGIQVSVPDNSETTFSAKQRLAGIPSDCSAGTIAYREVTPPPDPGGGGSGGGSSGGGAVATLVPTAPPPPPRLRTVPGGFASDNTPLVTGTAPGASTVRVYADPKCGGYPVATASLAGFLAGLEVRVLDNDVTVFSATASNGKVSPCSEPVVYIEDSLAPRTRITMGPAAKTAKRKAIFRFMDTTGNAPGTRFLCRIDGRKWKQCASPLRLRNLKPKRYTVQVKAADPAGNVETKGAKRSFKVVPRP
ncbi:MAG TPA: hypothetical protein VMS60_13900 [Solirubrobacterales bacterium]|nr:hypothetical protein [Solirubrobacterales bacterium]